MIHNHFVMEGSVGITETSTNGMLPTTTDGRPSAISTKEEDDPRTDPLQEALELLHQTLMDICQLLKVMRQRSS